MNDKEIERLIGEWQIANDVELGYKQFQALKNKFMSDQQKSAEVLDAFKRQEIQNIEEAKKEYAFLFGPHYKDEDFWDYYYNEFCK